MVLSRKVNIFAVLSLLLMLVSTVCADNSYDRELIVKDQRRADQVEVVFKQLMAAYEDEDPQGFLDLVSDERFRQDYITFTDALYSDFRTYEIHDVDYWIDRVVPDHIKQFVYVRWEKRYEDLDDGRQLTRKGFSRFLFDEVDGQYLLIELAGNHLFGESLQEWREEVPPISGQELTAKVADNYPVIDAVCDAQHLYLCDVTNCAEYGGFWYDNTCNQELGSVCDADHLNLCDGSNCSSNGGYWYDNSCNVEPEVVCDADHLNLCSDFECQDLGFYWYDAACHIDPQGLPDLEVIAASWESGALSFTVKNTGPGPSTSCDLEAVPVSVAPMAYIYPIPALVSGQSYSTTIEGVEEMIRLIVDINDVVEEQKETNNEIEYPF